jgi:predicted DNA-binding WGR domain protein
MNAVTLRRIDPSAAMHRFYRMDVQPDLFGEWGFIREWGRIGSAGQMKITLYPTPESASAAMEHQRRAKERRGYQAP